MDIFLASDLLTDDECDEYVLDLLHPDGVKCPAGHKLKQLDRHIYKTDLKGVHRYKCSVPGCKKTFNLYTGTFLQGKSYNPRKVIDCINGILAKMPCEQLAKELGIEKRRLNKTYHHFKELAELSKKKSEVYKDWEKTFKKVLAAGEDALPPQSYSKLKRLMENIINSRSRKIDWLTVLKEVEHWEMAEKAGKVPDEDGDALYIKTKSGERFILQRHSYKYFDPKRGKKGTETDTMVEEVKK